MGTKNLSFKQSIIPVITLIIFILGSVFFMDVPIQLALFFEVAVTIFLALYWGYCWEEIEEMLFSSFRDIGHVLIILLLIGMLIGIWIANGTVPAMIYYGLKILSPRYFLVLSFIITSLVSMAIGTAFGTASTIGLALISIAQGLKLPLPMVAGAIISGSYVGDRMSPISSLAHMTAHSAGANFNKMIKYMVYTMIPTYIITFVIYLLIGLFFLPANAHSTEVNTIIRGLEQNFIIKPWLLLLPLLIILLAFKRLPTIINLIINIFSSIFMGLLISGKSLPALLNSLYRGVNSQTGNEILDNLLTRGGLTGMLELIALIIFAVILGGLLNELGILKNILSLLIKKIHNRGQLISITMVSSFITAILSCNQLLSVFLPGKMIGKKYDEMGIPRQVLGRALGDSGLIMSPLIPWNVNALMMTGILGVSTIKYLPYAFLPLFLPLISLVFGFRTKKQNEL